jgi:hypothetical protein
MIDCSIHYATTTIGSMVKASIDLVFFGYDRPPQLSQENMLGLIDHWGIIV